ncbi:hypothetical protein BJ165DRAFT_1427326 [Panaeolus papilionaceus]|nr:hypothetical protein BJ165DRAFT_1427326 [Panaeolus papilionaceus]
MSNLTRTVVKLSLSAFAAPSTVLSCLRNGNDYALKAGKPNNTPKELFLTGEFKSGVLAGAQNAAIHANLKEINKKVYDADPELRKETLEVLSSPNTFEIRDLTQAIEKFFGIDYELTVKMVEQDALGNLKFRLDIYLMQAIPHGEQMASLEKMTKMFKDYIATLDFVVEGLKPGQKYTVEANVYPAYFIMSRVRNYLIHYEQLKYALALLSFDRSESGVVSSNKQLDNEILKLIVNKGLEYDFMAGVERFTIKKEYIGTGGVFKQL